MYLIKRLWVDPSENRDAYGYTSIGVVSNKGKAERICNLEFVKKNGWPLAYAHQFKGDFVPRFIMQEIVNIDCFSANKLLIMEEIK